MMRLKQLAARWTAESRRGDSLDGFFFTGASISIP